MANMIKTAGFAFALAAISASAVEARNAGERAGAPQPSAPAISMLAAPAEAAAVPDEPSDCGANLSGRNARFADGGCVYRGE